jgi:hypothetical protein
MRRSPADIVKRYVLLDQKGARLDASSFDTVMPYVEWKEEPAWGRIVVVQKTTVSEDYRQWEIVNNLEVIIPVTFQVRGSVYLIPPHVGLRRMVSFARDAALHESDDTQRTVLTDLIESLRKAN